MFMLLWIVVFPAPPLLVAPPSEWRRRAEGSLIQPKAAATKMAAIVNETIDRRAAFIRARQ